MTIRTQIGQYALAVLCMLAFGTRAAYAQNDTSASKVSPALVPILQDTSAALQTKDYPRAQTDLASARAQPHLTAFDQFMIHDMAELVAIGLKDYDTAVKEVEALAQSPALTDQFRTAVYGNAFTLHNSRNEFWRAIQFGELMRREQLLTPEQKLNLPRAYFTFGAYADAERVAGEELATETDPKLQKKLQKIVGLSQIKEGKTVATPGFGEALGIALLGGITSGLTGQQVDTSGGDPQANMQQAASDAQTAIAQAQQQAASAVLGADVPSERAVYADLIAEGARASKADKAKANRAFQAAYSAWQKQDYAKAQSGFESGLALDPTNTIANYYYADCIARSDPNTLLSVEYLARAAAFGGPDAKMAREALQQFASPQPATGQ